MLIRISLVAAVILGLLGILITLFFRYYHGTMIPHTWLFWLGGLLLLVFSGLLLRYAVSAVVSKDRKQRDLLVDDLKAHGEKISVDFATCEIRSTDYNETKDRSDDGYGGLANMDRGSYSVDVRQSVFIFQQENARTGSIERFISPVIPKDMTTLSFYLDQQRYTTLYVDPNDRSRYYFDLDFLADA